MLLNWQGRHFMEINHSRITSYEIADYMIRTKSLLSAKELAAILEKEYPHLDVDKRDVYLRLPPIHPEFIWRFYSLPKNVTIISLLHRQKMRPVLSFLTPHVFSLPVFPLIHAILSVTGASLLTLLLRRDYENIVSYP